MKQKVELPDTLSALLRLAVSDCKKVEKMKTRKLDMGVWHTPSGKGCAVCMAGAVMDQTLRVPVRAYLRPGDVGQSAKLGAINLARTGLFYGALRQLCVEPTNKQQEVCLKAEEEISRGFDHAFLRADWPTYLKVADMLEKAGL